jgi:transposase-like protein
MAGRARHDVQFWAEHFTKQQASGLTLCEYCRREGIEVHQFYYWRKRAMNAASAVPLEKVERQSISGSEAASVSRLDGQQTIVIQMHDRTSIHVPSHMLETLESVLKMVQRLSDQGVPSAIGAFRSVAVRS